MFEEDREKFWRVFLAENRRMKINIRNLAQAVGYSSSTVDKFKRKCAGSDDLLEKISMHVFRKSWREVIAEQNAEQNGKQNAPVNTEAEKMSIGDLYFRLGEVQGEMKRELAEINKKLDLIISGRSHCASDDVKKTG